MSVTKIEKSRSTKSKREEDRELSLKLKKILWEPCNHAKLNDSATNIEENTSMFFQHFATHRLAFLSSSHRVLQFGISTGKFLIDNRSPQQKEIIGYDYSPSAIKHVEKNGIQGREIDLNDIDDIDDNRLAYHSTLQEDLSVPSHILIIRTLEYLNPEAMKLFIFSLISLAKRDSKFYIEIYNPENQTLESNNIEFGHHILPGYVPSFFAPRTDIEFLDRTTEYIKDDKFLKGDSSTTERFVFRKL